MAMTEIRRMMLDGIFFVFIFTMVLTPVFAGDRTVEPQVVGGQETTQSWPWMAVLVFADEPDVHAGFFCGGSLIAPNWVATAAHCVADELPDDVDIVLGVHDLEKDLSNGIGQRLSVKRIVIHPQYDARSNDFDMALLELEQAVSNTPIPVYGGQDALVGQQALILGWGNTQRRGQPHYPAALQQAFLPIVANSVCAMALAPYAITGNMLCAGYAEGGKDTCQGDSGGPLLVNLDGYQLAGVTSWGVGCARPGKYGVYTRAANFGTFIQDSQSRNYFACADHNGDGVVDEQDRDQKRIELQNAFNQWRQACWSAQAACGDVDGDGMVNSADKRARRRTMNQQYFNWQQSCWYPERSS
ncbi:MAG: serine protease [Gammaproteobacteria bacterium]|nr:serine protease [Gammaproteobacteria bacterium]